MKSPTLDPRLEDRLRHAERRFAEVDSELASPDVLSSPSRMRELGQERAHLDDLVTASRELTSALGQYQGVRELLNESDDSEMRALAEEELAQLDERIGQLGSLVRELLIPPDPLADRAAVVEIRAGTGGDEAGLFAADLMRMYRRLSERMGWKLELMSLSEGIPGSIKEAIFTLSGRGVYGRLRYESGVHRVQRVPDTESQGRIHTSAATVAVLPEVEDVDLEINTSDLRIDTYRASGAGGQHVNRTDSAVRITHLPTGVVVQCQDERSQHKNRDRAMSLLRTKLYDEQHRQAKSAHDADRRAQVGSGDRSERIRTYNFPQNRVTDHRINLTLHALDAVMEGGLDPVVEALLAAERTARMATAGLV